MIKFDTMYGFDNKLIMDNIVNKIDPESLSKPIGTVEEKTSWLDNLLNPQKKISFKKEELPVTAPASAEIQNQPVKIAEKNDIKGFFRNKSEEAGWPPEPGVRKETESQTSVRWIVAGSLTVVVLVVVILASFGLVNMIKDSIQNSSLTNIEQQIKQADNLLDQGNLNDAKLAIENILAEDGNNQKADELLGEINRRIGDTIIDNLLTYRETDLTDWPHESYIGTNQHFSVGKEAGWEALDSQYDVKFDTGNNNTVGVRSLPKIRNLTEAQMEYRQLIDADKYNIINQREDIILNGMKAIAIVAENDTNYLVTILAQKYYFAYEISGVISKNDSLNELEILKKFAASFNLLSEFELDSYDKLEAFTDTNFVFYSWPDQLSSEDKTYIINQFIQAYKNITDTVRMTVKENINVYIYPDWATLRTYSLAENSFSKNENKEMHIVFINRNEHQSFGYETTKLIIRDQITHNIEPQVLEGLATMLDQTGRDYRELVKTNKYIPIEQLLGIDWELDNNGNIKYYIAGTFAQYLVDRYGIDNYINLIKSEQFPIAYENIYSLTLSELETQYKQDLGI